MGPGHIWAWARLGSDSFGIVTNVIRVGSHFNHMGSFGPGPVGDGARLGSDLFGSGLSRALHTFETGPVWARNRLSSDPYRSVPIEDLGACSLSPFGPGPLWTRTYLGVPSVGHWVWDPF